MGGESVVAERLLEVRDDIVDVLHADGEADGRGRNVLLRKLRGAELGVRGRAGMDDQALDVGHVGQQREDLEPVDEAPGILLRSLDLKREDGSGPVGEIALIERVVGMVGKCGMVDFRHLGMLGKVFDDLERILRVALDAQRQRLDSLQEDPRVERADGRSGVAQDDGTDARHEGGGAGHVGEDGAVIARIRFGERGIFVGVGFPVELAAVHDHAAEGAAVAADELGRGVDHDVGSVLKRPN